jgi:FtsH-binding integral membrane protein
MALIGLIIATIVNIFVKSSGFGMILNYLGVLIFVGLTAWDTQKIKQMLSMAEDTGETAQKVALMGALSLYLDFINLFIHLLRIMGYNRN